MENRIKTLIGQLRRGETDIQGYYEFDRLVSINAKQICEEFSLRWLISIVDTYADYGHDELKAQATMISVFANMTKLADTILCEQRTNVPVWMRCGGVQLLYDEVNTFKITDGDMSQAMFFRIERALDNEMLLGMFWQEIKKRLIMHSTMLSEFDYYHEDFASPKYFEKRKNFLSCKKK